MNVNEALISRFSCRAYKKEPLSKELLTEIISWASHAPSWANTQPWEIFIASGEKLDNLRDSFSEYFSNDVSPHPDEPRPENWPEHLLARTQDMGAKRFKAMGINREDKEARAAMTKRNYRFFDAPAVIYLCIDKNLTPWSMFDTGLFAQSLMLAATEKGLATIPAYMLASFPDLIRQELNIPDHLKIVLGIAIGYPDLDNIVNKYRTERRDARDVVTFVGFK